MAEVTGIAWTDSTFNPWIGCTKVGPGCDHCYAEALDKRHRWGGATHWGVGTPRIRTSAANWRKPLMWQRHAEKGFLPDGKTPHGGRRPRVFCASLADVFDTEAPMIWRHDLWKLILATPALDWLLLTKRIGNVAKMWPVMLEGPPPNIWLGATIVNQDEADRDVPKLLEVPAAVRFVSYEPALGPVDWTKFPGIDWIIVGGESTQGSKAREFDIDIARHTIDQARGIGAAPFVKQLGSRPQEIAYPTSCSAEERRCWHADGWTSIHDGNKTHWRKYYRLHDRAGADPAEWPEDLRVQEFPVTPAFATGERE
jgi:protein gp37